MLTIGLIIGGVVLSILGSTMILAYNTDYEAAGAPKEPMKEGQIW
jgi:hypothetical protein